MQDTLICPCRWMKDPNQKRGKNKQDKFVFPHAEHSSGEPKQDESWLNTSFQDHQLTKAGNNLNQAHLKVQKS